MRKVLSILTLLFCTALWGCVQDSYDACPSPTSGDGSMTFTLNVRVPGVSTPDTRALTQADETEIRTLDLLVFEDDGNGGGKFRYRTQAQTAGTSGQNQSFRFALIPTKANSKDCFVLIANASDAVNKLNPAVGTGKTDLLKELTFDTSAAWNSETGNFTPLPMWAEASGIVVDQQNTSQNIDKTFYMLRAVARVDVGYKIPENPHDNLGTADPACVITALQVRNTPNVSRVVPDKGILTTSANGNGFKVKAPSLAEKDQNGNDVALGQSAYTAAQDQNGFWREVYVGEAKASEIPAEKLAKNPCLLVKVQDKGWYRLDFVAPDDKPLDILRNHRYRVNITAVTGPGYVNADDAFNAPASNLEYEVVEIDENYLDEIEYADGYYLAVDRSDVTLYARGDTRQQLIVKTTFDKGFEIEKGADTDWFMITATDAEDDDTAIDRVTTAGETAITIRSMAPGVQTGFFTIKAGKLSKTITVDQLDETLLSLTLSDEQVNFPQNPTAERTITVEWRPNDADLEWTFAPNSDISWNIDPTDKASGGVQPSGLFGIKMLPNPSNELRSAQLVFTLSLDGESITKKLTIIQYNGSMLFSVLNKELTIGAGEVAHTFKIKSTDDWTLKGAAPAQDVADVQSIELKAWDDGPQYGGLVYKDYKVTFAANNTWLPRTWHFIPRSDNPDWPENYGAWEITQKGAEPTLTVTADKQDFGAEKGASEIKVTVTTDAKWGFESPDGKAAWTAIAGVANGFGYGYPGGNDSENPDGHGTDNCGKLEESKLSFPGRSYDPADGDPIPAAGPTTVPLIFRTYTADQAAKESEQTLEFTRTVPGFFRSTLAAAPDKLAIDKNKLGYTGGDVEVKFATNMGWKLTTSNNVASENHSGKAAAYREVTQTVKISTPLWNENFKNDGKTTQFVTITARPDGTPAAGEPAELTAQVEQDAYYLMEAGWADGINETRVVTDGETPAIRVAGVHPDLRIVFRRVGTPEYPSDVVIPATNLTGPGDWTGTVDLPAMQLGWGDTEYDVFLYTADSPAEVLTRIGKIKVKGFDLPVLADWKTPKETSWWGNTVALTTTRPSVDIEWPEIEISIKMTGQKQGYDDNVYIEETEKQIYKPVPLSSDPGDPNSLTGMIFLNVPMIPRNTTKYEVFYTYKEGSSQNTTTRPAGDWTVTIPQDGNISCVAGTYHIITRFVAIPSDENTVFTDNTGKLSESNNASISGEGVAKLKKLVEGDNENKDDAVIAARNSWNTKYGHLAGQLPEDINVNSFKPMNYWDVYEIQDYYFNGSWPSVLTQNYNTSTETIFIGDIGESVYRPTSYYSLTGNSPWRCWLVKADVIPGSVGRGKGYYLFTAKETK